MTCVIEEKELKIFAIVKKEVKGYYLANYGILYTIKVDPFTTGYYEDEDFPYFDVELDFELDLNSEVEISTEGQHMILTGVWADEDQHEGTFLVTHMKLI